MLAFAALLTVLDREMQGVEPLPCLRVDRGACTCGPCSNDTAAATSREQICEAHGPSRYPALDLVKAGHDLCPKDWTAAALDAANIAERARRVTSD